MNNANSTYSKFREHKIKLANLLEDSRNIFLNLNMENQLKNITILEEKIKNDSFKVMVLGQFKVGKSTFINALLGEEILPAYSIPCTAVINEVKYSKSRSAILHFKDPIPDKIPDDINIKAKNYINGASKKNIAPLKINVKELEDYVVIPDPGKDQAESVSETPYEKIELFWDLKLCENGVEIIDSPGLNENIIRTKVTTDYLMKVDAVLFVMNCQALCAATEMEFIERNILKAGHEYIIFVNNRINQIREQERDRLIRYGNDKLSQLTEFREKGIFYINALDALDGRITNDLGMVKKSGIEDIEELLANFLTSKRGKIKLLQPSKELLAAIKEALLNAIPQQRKMLDTDLKVIEKKYNEIKPRLDDLEVKKRQIIQNLQNRIDRISLETRNKIDSLFNNLIVKTPSMLDNVQINGEFNPFKPKESASNIVKELLYRYKDLIEQESVTWINENITPYLESEKKELSKEFSNTIENFCIEVDDLKINLAGISDSDDLGVKKVSVVERIGAAALGIFVGDIGAGWVGASFGFGEHLWKQIALQVGAVVTMILIGITNPVTMIPVIVGIALFGVVRGKNVAVNKIRQTASNKIIEEIRNSSNVQAKMLNKKIYDSLSENIGPLSDALNNEIISLKRQVEDIIKEKKAGEASVEKRKIELNKYEIKLKQTDKDLNDLIFTVAST
jgi:GTPase SAR1 family protein